MKNKIRWLWLEQPKAVVSMDSYANEAIRGRDRCVWNERGEDRAMQMKSALRAVGSSPSVFVAFGCSCLSPVIICRRKGCVFLYFPNNSVDCRGRLKVTKTLSFCLQQPCPSLCLSSKDNGLRAYLLTCQHRRVIYICSSSAIHFTWRPLSPPVSHVLCSCSRTAPDQTLLKEKTETLTVLTVR